MSEEEDEIVEPMECEEEEEEESSDFIADSDDEDPDFLRLYSEINTYNAFIYQYPANISDRGLIKFVIPSNYLPLAQQSAYGFNVHKTLLEVTLELSGYNWRSKPKTCILQHPIYQRKFTGERIINDVVNNFFSNKYTPRKEYRSAKFILSPDCGTARQDLVERLVEEGFDAQRASSALILSQNKYEAALNFLKTGVTPPMDTAINVSYSQSPLVYFTLEIVEAFIDLSDHCCICRKPLGESTVKPWPCNNELCQMCFTDLGVGVQLLQEIRRDPDATDLLISCFSCAVGTKYLTPAPNDFSENQMKKIVNTFPSVAEMANQPDDQSLINLIGSDSYLLLRFILLSNKSQIISLPSKLRVNLFKTKHQFLTLISSWEKEEKFREYKAKYGSCFLWHGSSSDRWHSIIRNGLKNCSGTDLQLHGAAYGKGIYLSPLSSYSSNYTVTQSNSYKNSRLGSPFVVIALCEVAKVPELVKQNHQIYTCGVEDAIIVRFLFTDNNMNYNTLENPPRDIPGLDDVLKYMADN